jgi:general secretion pathway protein F
MIRRRYAYRARRADGAIVSDTVVATSRVEVLRQITSDRSVPIEIRESAPEGRSRAISAEEPAMAMRQLAVMAGSGIDLLEALDTVAGSFPGSQLAQCLQITMLSLKRGNGLAVALRESAPLSYPDYVYALIAAGEASGRLATVLHEAASRLEADRQVRRDIQNALVYPAFLLTSGAASVLFLLYSVVPRFSQMLTNANAEVSGFPRAILAAGVLFHDHAALIMAMLAAGIAGVCALTATREGRNAIAATAAAIPVLGHVLRIRQRAAWARTMALSLGAGVGILEATALAASALPDGELRRGARASIAALKSGKPVDEAYLSVGALSPVDASLVRAGQRAGALPDMFRVIADRNDANLKDALKRFTLIIEPIAIALVSGLIGAILLGLVSALVSIYDSIG